MYPQELAAEGLTKEVLESGISGIQVGTVSVWHLSRTPTVGFYRALHNYLRKHFTVTKTTIGKFYSAIDSNLDVKGCRPDNTYRFVDVIVSSKRSSKQSMVYDTQPVKTMTLKMKKCSQQLELLTEECADLRSTYEKTTRKLKAAREKIGTLKHKNAFLEDECTSLQADLISDQDSEGDSCDEIEPSVQSIIKGSSRKYSPEIRKLYYSLLADQVPVSKIADIIRSVLKCFNPTVNIEELELPKKSCASYMRKEELSTISNAHKATVICNHSKELHINTDGTTKCQKKLGGVIANNMVLSVNELSDGSAVSVIDDISGEFKKLRHAAHMLGLPNPDAINWTLVVSSKSDSAATQKRVNKLIEEKRQADEEKFGSATVDTIDLVETFCSMHLGVNLRKAFLAGIVDTNEEKCASEKRYHRVDTLVHEFCKLLGSTGVPEYCLGVVSFPDFLEIKISSCDDESRAYYKDCSKIRLHRQVGSRYFVTAANACKINFLRDAAVEFLKFTGRDAGNKLEQNVFLKLQDPIELAHLKADSLMYYHVYGDLYMLSKSNDLDLSVLSMNRHYLELQLYLTEVEMDPDVVFDPNYRVFPTERRIYGSVQCTVRWH